MLDVDFFDTNLTHCLGKHFVDLLSRKLGKLTTHEVLKDDDMWIDPVFHGSVYRKCMEEAAAFAISWYNQVKGKNLNLVHAYKGNMICYFYCNVFFISLYAVDNGIKKAFRTCVLCPRVQGAPKMLMWSFKPISYRSPVMEFQYQEEEDDDGGWETESFKDFNAFRWDLLDYHRDDCPDESMRDLVYHHTYEVRRSKGFDVYTFPPSFLYRWLRPITPDCHPRQHKLIGKAARFAVDQYNYRTGKSLKLQNVCKTNVASSVVGPVVGDLYFITLDALYIPTSMVKRFQTQVLVEPNGKSMRVRYFKSKRT